MSVRRIRYLALATPLLAVMHPGFADSPWDCIQRAGAVWECNSKVSPEGTTAETLDNGTNSIPADETPPPASAVESPAAAGDAAASPAAVTEPLDTPAAQPTDTRTLPAPFKQPTDTGIMPEPVIQPTDTGATPAPVVQPTDTGTSPAPANQVTDTVTRPAPAVQPTDTGTSPAPADSEIAETDITETDVAETDTSNIAATDNTDTDVAETDIADSATPTADKQHWSQCLPAPLPEHLATIDDPETVDLRADSIHASSERVFTLSGDAVIRYGKEQLQAGSIIYKRADGELVAEDRVRFAGPNLVVTADNALIETQAERGRLENITFTVPGQHARGRASTLGFKGLTWQYLEQASYTACPPDNEDWLLTSKKIELDQAKGSGVARNAKITLKGVPLLYAPYISFPLDDRRKSGLLFPKVGTSDENGLDISLPWYWNIAPHRDLTLIPRLMTDRGVMIGADFRYLNRHNSGSISGEYLANDKEFDDQDRSLVRIRHNGNPVPRLSTRIEASSVSDKSYFEDLGSNLVQTSQTSLERTAQATWHADSWQVGITLQDFQNVDASLPSVDRPYKQLPKIVFSTAPDRRILGLQASAEAELNHFTHSNNTLVTGSRFDLTPRISLPLERPGWYIKPTVAVRHTVYQLDNVGIGKPTDPDRTLPIATLDLGTVFERNGSWSGRPYIQTLEPRLFYLYVPNKDQDNLPIFDTDNYDQNFWSLFRENRFSGPDRMGDANQLAVALSTRIVDPASGRQLLSASLGSLLYFRDRTVILPGETVATQDSSDLIAELSVGLSRRWRVLGEVHWNPHTSQSVRNDVQLQYRAGPRRLLNMGYRFRDGIQEQVDLSFLWPFGRAWHAVGRWYYAIDDNETIEALAGLGYERCCWEIQLLARSYINNDSSTRNNAVFFQLELKGLGKLGTSVDDALERGILGYQATN